jgi:hypothetical protein
MKRITAIAAGAVLSMAFTLTGCFDTDETQGDHNVTGKVMTASYLDGSKVSLSKKDTKSKNGDYKLTGVSDNVNDAIKVLVATKGTDGSGKENEKLTAVKDVNQSQRNITPLTTLVEAVYQLCKGNKCSVDQATMLTVDGMNALNGSDVKITKEQMDSDVVALAKAEGEDRDTLPFRLADFLVKLVERYQNQSPVRVSSYFIYQEIAKEVYKSANEKRVMNEEADSDPLKIGELFTLFFEGLDEEAENGSEEVENTDKILSDFFSGYGDVISNALDSIFGNGDTNPPVQDINTTTPIVSVY